MLSQLDFKIFGLQTVKDLYVDDADFKDVFTHCVNEKPWGQISHAGRVAVSLTSCAFQLARFVFCYCRKRKEAVSWGTSAFARRTLLHVALLVK
jgi:hypothetical protein